MSEILFQRAGMYDLRAKALQAQIDQLLQTFGNWDAIPGEKRTLMTRRITGSGFTYDPTTGLWPPNSVDLSSL